MNKVQQVTTPISNAGKCDKIKGKEYKQTTYRFENE